MYKLILSLSFFLIHPLSAAMGEIETFDPTAAFARLKLKHQQSPPLVRTKRKKGGGEEEEEEGTSRKKHKPEHIADARTVAPLYAYRPVGRKRKFKATRDKEEKMEALLHEGLRHHRKWLLYKLAQLEREDRNIENEQQIQFIEAQLELAQFILS